MSGTTEHTGKACVPTGKLLASLSSCYSTSAAYDLLVVDPYDLLAVDPLFTVFSDATLPFNSPTPDYVTGG